MFRDDFPILNKKINGFDMVYFDNGATSEKPLCVIDSISKYYSDSNSNVHRGINPLAEEATGLYEGSRFAVAKFINAKSSEIIFTRNATESINLVVKTWGESNLKMGDKVVLTIAEHHANIVPWLQLKEKIGIEIVYIPVLKETGELDYDFARNILSDSSVKFLSIAHVSNVLGVVNDVESLIEIASKNNIITLVDASQSVSHFDLDVKKMNCDFLVFSGHKVFGPTGVGVLYGKENILNSMPAFIGGGDMIKSVYLDSFTTNDLPYKFEAGTPNISGVVGLGSAVGYINSIGFDYISSCENVLKDYFLERIESLKFISIIGVSDKKLPIFSFTIEGVHPHDASDLLGQCGIILRAGHHCAQPLHDFYGINSTLRASLCFYNTREEIDVFVEKLKELHYSFHV